MSAKTFGERFLAEFRNVSAEAVRSDTGVPRRRAARVLKGIPWQFIPVIRGRGCRGAWVGLRGLFMLCCCLDVIYDDDRGATPGRVTVEEIYLAWTAAGFKNWLQRITLRRLRDQADREVLRQHSDLFVGSLLSALERPSEDEDFLEPDEEQP